VVKKEKRKLKMMKEKIKENKTVIAIVLIVLILVVIRSLGTNHFKGDAKKLAVASLEKSNLISKEKIGTLSGEKLLIILGQEIVDFKEFSLRIINISPADILIKNNLKMIRKNNGPVLLYSSDPSVSSRIWIILSQMGIKNIFILTNDTDNEVLKYKFRPDSVSGTEL
jgi:hypothetical protein